MSEIKAVKKASEISDKSEPEEEIEALTEEEAEELEPEKPEEEAERYAEVIEATEKSEKVKVLFELDKRTAKKLTELCDILDKTKREFIVEAIKEHIEKFEDLSFLESFNLSDPYVRVDDFIAHLKARHVTVLMPKALKKIRENLEPKWAITLGVNKWVEFCRKMGIDQEEAEKPTHAFFIKWK